MNSHESSTIYTQLDAPKRYFTITLDELVPTVCLGGLILALTHGAIFALIAGLLVLQTVRLIKKKESPYFWLALAYAYCPRLISRLWFVHFPDDANKHYLT